MSSHPATARPGTPPATPHRTCRACGSGGLQVVLDLGDQPAADLFPAVDDPLPDPRWPLSLHWCPQCSLVQLGAPSPAPEVPLAVESRTMLAHAESATRGVVAALGLAPGATVREFASDHGGHWLPALTAAGLVPVDAGGLADLVVDNHGLIHAEDLAGAIDHRVAALAPGGRLVLEFHHLLALVEQGQFDTVRHGHPNCLSVTALQHALAARGLEVLDAREVPVYGGSCLVVAGRRGEHARRDGVQQVLDREREGGLDDPERLRGLQYRAHRSAAAVREHLVAARARGLRVIGYGAPSKASALLGLSGVGPDLLEATADLSPGKHGRRVPGAGIPIISPAELVARAPDEVLVLTWDIVEEVRAQLAPSLPRTRFVVPLPEVRVVG